MPFYDYKQNNSGGSFHYDEERGISCHVIVEADSADEANERAERIGLYFDGYGDCECCGDRWSPMGMWGEDEGTETPQLYAEEVSPGDPLPPVNSPNHSSPSKWMDDGQPEGFIHYKGNPEPQGFYAVQAPPIEVNGKYGWAAKKYNHESVIFEVHHNGWDITGMHRAPGAGDDGVAIGWVMPSSPIIRDLGRRGLWAIAWFPTKEEAEAWVRGDDFPVGGEDLPDNWDEQHFA